MANGSHAPVSSERLPDPMFEKTAIFAANPEVFTPVPNDKKVLCTSRGTLPSTVDSIGTPTPKDQLARKGADALSRGPVKFHELFSIGMRSLPEAA
jgi:hypothetical protein